MSGRALLSYEVGRGKNRKLVTVLAVWGCWQECEKRFQDSPPVRGKGWGHKDGKRGKGNAEPFTKKISAEGRGDGRSPRGEKKIWNQ